ncbi:MAG: NifU family protein [Flavobacteriales bacterium]|nr:NifU family protein [Flavobacteriales bacterium]
MNSTDLVNVYAEATPNPGSMKFVINRMICPNESVDFRNEQEVTGSPLAAELFKFPFVNGIFIMNNFITITKSPDSEWAINIPQLRDYIKSYLESGKTVIEKRTELSADEENEVITKIKKLLEDHVKPAVEMDGGAIDFKTFEQGVVTVTMKGSCSGCPSSTLTLKAGIENLLKRMVPEVQAVEAESV